MMESTAPTTSPLADQPWGYQLILDCFGCSHDICCDLDNGYEFLDQICDSLEMTKQTQPYIFKTCDRAFPGRPGYSGWVPIIESGIQIHTSAKNHFVSIDIYSCKLFDQTAVQKFTMNWFAPEGIDARFFCRGRDFLSRSMTPRLVPQQEEVSTL